MPTAIFYCQANKVFSVAKLFTFITVALIFIESDLSFNCQAMFEFLPFKAHLSKYEAVMTEQADTLESDCFAEYCADYCLQWHR